MKKMKQVFVAGMLLSTVVACSEPESKVVNLHSKCKTAVAQEQFKLNQEKNVILKMGTERIELSNELVEKERFARESTLKDPSMQIDVAETAESIKALDLEINNQIAPLVEQRELTKTAIDSCEGVDSDALNAEIDADFDEVVGQVAGVVVEDNFAEESVNRLASMLTEETIYIEALKGERDAVSAERQSSIDATSDGIEAHEASEYVANIKKLTERLEKLDADILMKEEKIERLTQGHDLSKLVFDKKEVTEELDSLTKSDLDDIESASDLNAYLDKVKSLQGEKDSLDREIKDAQ